MGAASSAPDAGSASCDAGAGCAPLPCEPGALRCSGSALEECTAGQSWLPQQDCASSCLCELGLASGTCAAPSCTTGEARCSGSRLETCNACLTGYELLADCGSAGACNVPALRCDVVEGEPAPGAGEETPPAETSTGADAGAP